MWIRVTRTEKCAICGKDTWCQRTADGQLAHCMRVESVKPASGDMGGWIHRLADPLPAIVTPLGTPKEKPLIDWTALAQSMFETGAEERYYLAKTLGVKESALVELQVGRGWDDYRHLPFSSWPERDATGRVVGIVRRYRDGSKKTMRHSSHGLYYSLKLIRQSNGPILLPEGGSDTAALLGIGLNVIGRPSNLGGVEQLTTLLKACPKKHPVIVLGERDEKHTCKSCHGCLLCWPGLAGARETAKRLEQRLKRTVHWTLPEGKDVRAWLNGREVTAVEFLGELRAWRAESATLRLRTNTVKPRVA